MDLVLSLPSATGRSSNVRAIVVQIGVWFVVAAALLVSQVGSVTAEEPALTQAESRRLLIDGEVLDSITNERVETFRVIPGVRYNSVPGARGNVAVWQPHMIREMKDGIFQWPRTRGYDEMRFRIEADGYRAATTTWLGKGGPHLRMKVHLRPDEGIEGVVVSPDGSLAAGATLAIGLPNRGIRLNGCKVESHDQEPANRLSDQWRRPLTIQTNDQGEFVLPYESDPSAVLCVVHESGYLEETFVDWASVLDQSPSDSIIVQLEPWARIQGRVYWKDRPGQGSSINLTMHRSEPYPGLAASYSKATSDAEGNFVFAYVPPGSVQVSHVVNPPVDSAASPRGTVLEYPQESLFLKPGQTKVIEFGGEGIEVCGKLSGLDSYQGVTLSIRPPAPDVWRMPRLRNNAVGKKAPNGYVVLQKTDYAPLYFRDAIPVADDGSFCIQDVMTGQYNVWVQGASGSSRFNLTSEIGKPLDIGTIAVQPAPKLLELPDVPR
ncbi:hypothetical protein [Planctomycetes bacterium K23_9]|uniref:Carboxypeptidase regulatory-like domain-containing protein n=1 Tax=Stieleria marina TaxID=1930275 RepID=A0A517P2L7_9BACT|nr:hypothetical protein K239x_56420 [Planctomycetes bacterium K23_9]